MKFFLICVLSFSFNGFSKVEKTYQLQEKHLSFYVEDVGGQWRAPCTHKILSRQSFDWEVSCKNNDGIFHYEKVFRVHLLLKEHHLNSDPKYALETLYWVNNKEATLQEHKYSEITFWTFFKDKNSLNKIKASHSIENGTRLLRLKIDPLKK